MKDTRLLQIFQKVKDTICKYDCYIHISKKIIHNYLMVHEMMDRTFHLGIEKMLRAGGLWYQMKF